MREHPLRQILSRILQRPNRGSDFEVSYVHRGAPGDSVTISVSKISRLQKGSFVLEDKETQIPFHRILYVKRMEDALILWEKRRLPVTPSRSL